MNTPRATFAARLRATRERMPWWSSHLLAVGVVLVVLGAFLRLTLGVFEDARVSAFDRDVMRWVVEHRTDALDEAAVDLTALGSKTLITLFALGGIFILLVARDYRGALHLLVAIVGSTLMMFSLKEFLERPRPPVADRLVEAGGWSYPSGHSISAAVLYVTLALVGSRHFKGPDYRRMLMALAVLTTALVASSRVYLGVHYPTDVASGTVLGAGWSVLLAAGFAYVDERISRMRALRAPQSPPPPPVDAAAQRRV